MWYKFIDIAEWFGELGERYNVMREFNKAAKFAFISGQALTLLNAKTTIGDSNYRHAFSKWMSGGFRIKALSGRSLPKSELIEIGKIVLDNETLVRKLIALGWDTLEVHDDKGFQGVKFPLKEHANIGGFLN